jgi:uncharacterized membrane protein YphA (DoxX/SURF4 family)
MSVTQESQEARLGRIMMALGLLGFGAENILFGHYVVARAAPWPDDQSMRFAVACVTAAVFLPSGLALLTGRFVRLAGLASGALILGWTLVLHLPVALAGPAWGGDWTNFLKAAALASGLFGVAAADGRPLDRLMLALRTLAPYAAGAFFLLCGIQHFMFSTFVATLVPRFIPGAMFWTYFAGVALIAAGLSFWTPPMRRVAATLAAAMVLSWVFLVHLPLVVTVGRGEWMGVFEALAISGVCLVLARWPASRPG